METEKIDQFSFELVVPILILILSFGVGLFVSGVSPTPTSFPIPQGTPPAFFAKHVGELTEQEMKEAIRVMSCEVSRLAMERVRGSVAPFNADLSYGMRGGRVKDLQLVLIAAGHLDYWLDTGFFGAKTRLALMRYQEERNIVPASGYFGAATRDSTNSLLADMTLKPLCW